MRSEDQQQIENLIYYYSIHLDTGDEDSLCGMFAHGELELPALAL